MNPVVLADAIRIYRRGFESFLGLENLFGYSIEYYISAKGRYICYLDSNAIIFYEGNSVAIYLCIAGQWQISESSTKTINSIYHARWNKTGLFLEVRMPDKVSRQWLLFVNDLQSLIATQERTVEVEEALYKLISLLTLGELDGKLSLDYDVSISKIRTILQKKEISLSILDFLFPLSGQRGYEETRDLIIQRKIARV